MRPVTSLPCAPVLSATRRWAPSIALAAVLFLPLTASAALVVDDDGTYDAVTEGCDGGDAAFTTINAAHAAAVDGDTIFVCPGTYAETQVHITKAITLQGSGAESTIIDGGGLNNAPSPGTLVISSDGDVTVDGFTIQNPSRTPGGLAFGIQAESDHPVTFTITNNVIRGTNDPSANQDYGFYSDGPNALETLIFQHNTITQTGSNPILLENHTGPTDVSFNTIDRGVAASGVSAYFNFAYNDLTITSLQRVSHNVFNMASDPGPYTAGNASGAITFSTAFLGTNVGAYTNVEIVGNTIVGLESFRRGISLVNNSVAGSPTNGEITSPVISCNRFVGNATPQEGSLAIRILGFVSNPQITGNDISGVAVGFAGQLRNGHIASGIVLNENSFTNIGQHAIDWQSDVSFDAERNWFGDASGPAEANGNPGGTGAAIVATGGPVGSPVLDYVPWLGNGDDADAGTCFVPGDAAGDCFVGPVECDAIGSCTGTPEDAGVACADDGEVCSLDVCDGAGACVHPAGNAGTECRAPGDACEEPAVCDGVSPVCPDNPEKTDTDSDGQCDEIDACTTLDAGQIFATKPKSRVVLAKINTDVIAGNDTLMVSGQFILPEGTSFADIDPLNDGVRLVIVAQDDFPRVDVTVPPGAFTKESKVGWKLSKNQKNWTFVDRNKIPATGINQVVINDRQTSKAPRRVKVTVRGKKSTFPVVEGDVPIKATVTLGDETAAQQGLCGESAYTAPDCKFNAKKNRLTCRR